MPYHDECCMCLEEFKCQSPCSCLVSVQAFVWLGGEERLMSDVPMYFCGAECVEKHLYELRERLRLGEDYLPPPPSLKRQYATSCKPFVGFKRKLSY